MNRLKSLLSSAVMALAVFGFSHAAHAQTITLLPAAVTDPSHPLTFNNVPVGAISQTQSVTVTASALTTVLVQPIDTPWLVFPNGPIYHPGPSGTSILVAVSAAGLAEGDYSGSFSLSISQYVWAIVYVHITVSGASALAAYPSSLSFSAQQGALAAVPSSAVVTITSSGTALGYTLFTQVQAGDANWILLSSTTGVSGYSSFLVQTIPSGLAVGTHTGSITAYSTNSNDSVSIGVTLTVYPNSVLSVTPDTPGPFLWQIGTSDPPPQRFLVNSLSGTVSFSARLSPYVSWATLSPFVSSAGPFTPAALAVVPTPNLFGLTQGTYTTYLIVTPLGGADLPAIPITLIATPNPFFQLSAAALSFTAQFGSGQAPPDQVVTVSSSSISGVGFTVTSDSPWLSASASSPIASSTLTVHVNPGGLPVGTFLGNLTLFPTNGAGFSQNISVTLMVVSSSQLSVGPSQVLFSYELGFPQPPTQTVQVRSSGPAVSFTVAAVTASCGSNWLTAVPSSYTTPATLTVGVLPPTFAPVSCQGIVTLNYNSGSGPATAVVYVTLAVSATSELTLSMPSGFGDESAQQGAGPYTRQIIVGSTDPSTAVNFSASVFNLSGGPWLGLAGISTGVTPQVLTIQINPSAVPGPGVYTGNLMISSFSLPGGFITIPMTLRVTSGVTVSVSPTSLSFGQAQGGPLPGAQTLSLFSISGNATFAANITPITGGSWLRASPTSGQANGNLQVSVLPNSLPQGDYAAQILFTFQNAGTTSITVNVNLHVGPPQRTLNVLPQAMSFSYQIGGSQPAAQKIAVTSTGGVVDFTVGFTSSGWLSTDVSTGSTPKNVDVLVNTLGLTVAGSPYRGTVSVSAPGVLASPAIINVTLFVTTVATPVPTTVASNASGAFGAIAPGELITIKGTALGPDAPANGTLFSINAQGNVDSTLAGVRVLFSNIPGTPTYVSPGQINVIVPYEVEGLSGTSIVVEREGVPSAPIPMAVTDTAPGLYTDNFTGTGQVAAANQSGTLNGPAGGGFSPENQGNVLTIYATGFGQTSPHSITGSVTPLPHSDADLLRVKGTVTATNGSQNAEVQFAGAAPGMVTGVIQLNIKVPAGVSGDHLPISVSVDGKSTPLVGTTVAVR